MGMNAIAAIAASIVGLALVAVLVSKNSQTSSVIQAGSTGFSSILSTAMGQGNIGGSGTGGLLSNSAGIWT
jgi:K+-transporting ATPase A subunit